MPTDVTEVSVAANAVVENVLSGSPFEFVGRPSRVDVGIVGSATGLEADVLFGADVQTQAMPVPAWVAANRGPIFPDDIAISEAALPGDRIQVRLRNTTAGALTARVAVRITPVG